MTRIQDILKHASTRGNWAKKCGVSLKPKIDIDCENEFIDDIYNELFKDSKYHSKHLYKPALNCIVANLVYCGRNEIPLYSPNSIYLRDYKWGKQTILNNVLKDLTSSGYCLSWPGFHHPTNPNYSFGATYFPTEKIMNENLDVKPRKPECCILLYKKDPKKRRVLKDYLITPQKQRMINNVNSINDILENSTVRFRYKATNVNFRFKPSFENQIKYLLCSNHIKLLPNQQTTDKEQIWIDSPFGTRLYFNNEYEFEICKSSMFVYRSFTRGKFEFGGRFYTPVFQGIPSYWRSTIKIDGEVTIELDYSAHHIRLLYHQDGIDFNGEAYVYKKSDMEHKDIRQIHKYIAMIAINALDKTQAINAVYNSIEDDAESGKYTSEIPSKQVIENYYDEFLEYHKPIARYISNDVGIVLQRKDSDIMNEILIELTKENIVGLPIHDSIIVKLKHKDKLEEEMTNQYYKKIANLPIVS